MGKTGWTQRGDWQRWDNQPSRPAAAAEGVAVVGVPSHGARYARRRQIQFSSVASCQLPPVYGLHTKAAAWMHPPPWPLLNRDTAAVTGSVTQSAPAPACGLPRCPATTHPPPGPHAAALTRSSARSGSSFPKAPGAPAASSPAWLVCVRMPRSCPGLRAVVRRRPLRHRGSLEGGAGTSEAATAAG